VRSREALLPGDTGISFSLMFGGALPSEIYQAATFIAARLGLSLRFPITAVS
jgi:hypothetical protein